MDREMFEEAVRRIMSKLEEDAAKMWPQATGYPDIYLTGAYSALLKLRAYFPPSKATP